MRLFDAGRCAGVSTAAVLPSWRALDRSRLETDIDAALEVLPAPLAMIEPAIAALSFYEYPWSTFGPYNEAILSLMVEHKGRPLLYIHQIAVTTEPLMLGGSGDALLQQS